MDDACKEVEGGKENLKKQRWWRILCIVRRRFVES